MNERRKIHILDSPHRDQLSADPASTVELVYPQVLESDEAVVELDSINMLEAENVRPELATS